MTEVEFKEQEDWRRRRFDEFMLLAEVADFNTRYAEVLDQGNLKDWPRFFAPSPFYKITARENFDGGFPIGIMYCDSVAMLEDRVTAILNSMEFSPRIITHLIANHRVWDITDDGFLSRANFILVENVLDQKPTLLMAGQYHDKFVRADGRLLLKERICVYDSILIQTSIIYPV